MSWTKLIPTTEITNKVTEATVNFAKEFGEYLATGLREEKLTTNQLRKFFGEVKRQQLQGYNQSEFVMLKPKLAYAVGRAKNSNSKIKDFYFVMTAAIETVKDEKTFKNFITVFEAIVAYHKFFENKKN